MTVQMTVALADGRRVQARMSPRTYSRLIDDVKRRMKPFKALKRRNREWIPLRPDDGGTDGVVWWRRDDGSVSKGYWRSAWDEKWEQVHEDVFREAIEAATRLDPTATGVELSEASRSPDHA